MTASPINWETVQEALRTWVVNATELDDDRVIWAYPENPQPLRPFAWISIIAGPRPLARPESRRTSQVMRDRISIDAATVQPYGARIFEAMAPDEDGTLYEYEAQLGDDATAIRDGLAAELAASGLTISNDGANALFVDGIEGREHFHIEVSPTGSVSRTTIREAILETSYTPSEITVRVQVETDSQLPADHARDRLARCHAALGLRSARLVLQPARIAFHRAFPPIDLSPDHTSRMAQDFHFGVGAQADENVPWVRTATHSGSLCA